MNKPILFSGVATAIITPFSKDGIDFHSLGVLLEFQIESGIDAIVVCGTTAESATLSCEEQAQIIRFAVEKSAKRVPIIAGCGSNCTAHAITLAQQAQALSADGLLVVTPYYNRATPQGLIAHYTAIADSVDLPLLLYNVPSRTGVDLPVSVCEALSHHKNIVGIKEAASDVAKAQRIAAVCGEDFSLYSGEDALTLPMLSIGARGVVSVASNLIPAQMHTLCDCYFRADIAEAKRLSHDYLPLFDALFCEVNPIGVKYALSLLGMAPSRLRLPLCAPTLPSQKLIRSVIKQYF